MSSFKMSSFSENLEVELLSLFAPAVPNNVKTSAVQTVLGLTGSKEGLEFIVGHANLLETVVSLVQSEVNDICKNAIACLVNLSAEEEIVRKLLLVDTFTDLILKLLQASLDPCNELADIASKALSNITRVVDCSHKVAKIVLTTEKVGVDRIIGALCNLSHNRNADLHYLSTLLMNLSQVSAIRHEVMRPDKNYLLSILPFLSFEGSTERRLGAAGVIKNCCFDYDQHLWLLGEEVDILPHLLLPLAGPEEFDEEDMEKLPVDLQYLPTNKKREPHEAIRKMLIQALTKLCGTKAGRLLIKEKNAYIILRELHKWEEVKENSDAIYDLVDILIADEPEDGMEELHKIEIPKHVEEKFEKELQAAAKKGVKQ